MTTRIILTVALVGFLLPGYSHAQSDTSDDSQAANPAVQNRDDQKARNKRSANRSRKNGRDGRNSRNGPRQLFRRLDKNGNKVVTESELPPRYKPAMQIVDVNNNNEITLAELSLAYRRRDGRLRSLMGLPNPETPTAIGMLKRGQVPTPEQFLDQFDRDLNRTLSETEAPIRVRKNFSEIDRDGNGQLDRRELVSVVERLKAANESKTGSRYQTDPEKSKGVMPKRPPKK